MPCGLPWPRPAGVRPAGPASRGAGEDHAAGMLILRDIGAVCVITEGGPRAMGPRPGPIHTPRTLPMADVVLVEDIHEDRLIHTPDEAVWFV